VYLYHSTDSFIGVFETDMHFEFSPHQRLVHLWTLDSAERDAFLANEAAKKWSSSNRVLVEIACARSSEQLLATRKAYHVRYKKSLEEDVAHHTTGDFRKVLILEPNLVIIGNKHFRVLLLLVLSSAY